jgi:exopolysaccharide biosynthesis WecB/TagA/CpsF family protein
MKTSIQLGKSERPHFLVKPAQHIKRGLSWLMNAKLGLQPLKYRILGIEINNLTMSQALEKIIATAQGCEKQSFAFVNADCLNRAARDAAYGRVLSRQSMVFADGSGIRIAGLMRRINVVANVNGTDMFPLLCREASEMGLSVYLLGAAPGVADAVAQNMALQFPKLKIAGTQDGYFTAEETERVITTINASSADILLVALGAPRQEMWIETNHARLSPNVAIGVGGLFDFYSGRISRAPMWLREAGLEWIWRFLQEPSRMWRRYFVGNPLFLYRCWREQRAMKRRPKFEWNTASSGLSARSLPVTWKMRQKLFSNTKRLLDLCLASVGLLVLAPFFLLIAVAIKLESPGPVFFSQKRVGQGGRRFRMWKFRSMFIDAEARRAALLAKSDRDGSHFKMKSDPRVTRVGRFIRRASIDELPQLLNVLMGAMSIVGPRPNLETEVAKYKIHEFGRLDTKPGITCIWQVSGRAEVPWERQVEMDLDYVFYPSISSDINLILRTLPAILSGKGAY